MANDIPSILHHVSVGTDDLERASAFYDAVMPHLRAGRLMSFPFAVAYGKEFPEFWIGKPLDEGNATAGNGTHVCFIAPSREAVDASGMPFVLTARADCYLYRVPDAFSESVARSNLYREAGADLLYTPGVADRGEVAALVREVDGPMNFVVGKGTADYTLAELADLGVRRVSIGGSLLRAAFAFAERAAAEMQEQGRFTWAADQLGPADFDRLFAKRRRQ